MVTFDRDSTSITLVASWSCRKGTGCERYKMSQNTDVAVSRPPAHEKKEMDLTPAATKSCEFGAHCRSSTCAQAAHAPTRFESRQCHSVSASRVQTRLAGCGSLLKEENR